MQNAIDAILAQAKAARVAIQQNRLPDAVLHLREQAQILTQLNMTKHATSYNALADQISDFIRERNDPKQILDINPAADA